MAAVAWCSISPRIKLAFVCCGFVFSVGSFLKMSLLSQPCAYALVRLRQKTYKVRFGIISCSGLKYLFPSPQMWLDLSQGLVKNTCVFCCHKHGCRWFVTFPNVETQTQTWFEPVIGFTTILKWNKHAMWAWYDRQSCPVILKGNRK